MTSVGPSLLFALIWIGWLVSWIAAAFWSARTEKRVVTAGVGVYRVAILAGAILLTPWAAQIAAQEPIWNVGEAGAYALAGLTLAGILFAWWARIHLGRLWSSAVTRKEGHRVIDTGPYALVRHPIYTGPIAAIWATAVSSDRDRARRRGPRQLRPLAQGADGGVFPRRGAGDGRVRRLLPRCTHAGAVPASGIRCQRSAVRTPLNFTDD